MEHYHDYIWEEGIPKGKGKFMPTEDNHLKSYKIVLDPYRKWISIEQYRGKHFEKIIYDSKIFDFRHLKPINQTAWYKTPTDEENLFIIRDQNDRVILLEHYTFTDGKCCKCTISSPHGIPIGTQHIYYQTFADPFNGVELYDNNDHLVMFKKYAIDSNTNEFGELLEENWKGKRT